VAPLVVKGKVIVGVIYGDRGLNGFLVAFDAKTGQRLWQFNSIPKPGEPGAETWPGDSWKHAGGATWLTGSYDPDLNVLYWAIGNPSPDFNGDVREGDNLYTDSVVALDLDTGKMKWHFQFTPHDVMDWDGAEIPVLVDAPFEGKMRKLLVQADRNGFYYVLDRETGQFLRGNKLARQVNWATGLNAQGRPILVPGVAPSLTGTKVCPSSTGATNWMSPTYSPQTGLFYFVALEGCGFAPEGGGADLVASGATTLGGRLPVNTHGGNHSYTHPGNPGQMFNVVELIKQLRGKEGRRQVEGAELAFIHSFGGTMAQHCSVVLSRSV